MAHQAGPLGQGVAGGALVAGERAGTTAKLALERLMFEHLGIASERQLRTLQRRFKAGRWDRAVALVARVEDEVV